MKRLFALLFTAAVMLATVGVVTAHADPDPGGNSQQGLCTAYYNGQKKGHDKHGDPGPFQALEDAAANSDGVDNDGDDEVDEGDETYDDSTPEGDIDAAEGVWSYCNGMVGGNPDHGRYDCDFNEEGDSECSRNPPPNE